MFPLRQGKPLVVLQVVVSIWAGLFARSVNADCECGYSLNATTDREYTVFTEVLESDFTALTNITEDTDWVPQEWRVDKKASKGPYGRKTEVRNVVSKPVEDGTTKREDAGLELWVRRLGNGEEHVSVAEVDSRRSDMLYGSFRAAFETTYVNGTCSAFFWYLNDTQEIDMEFLSSHLKESGSPVNLVLHSILTLQNGGDAKDSPTYKIVPLPWNPSEGVHEYRFDWKPGSVSFYADGKFLAVMNDSRYVPSAPGKIVLSHWSNGQSLWSGGPPKEDAKMRVEYVKAYFNSSSSVRKADYANRCKDPNAENAICEIPNVEGPPTDGNNYFFHQDPKGNKTVNQTIYGAEDDESMAARLFIGGRPSAITLVALTWAFLKWGL